MVAQNGQFLKCTILAKSRAQGFLALLAFPKMGCFLPRSLISNIRPFGQNTLKWLHRTDYGHFGPQTGYHREWDSTHFSKGLLVLGTRFAQKYRILGRISSKASTFNIRFEKRCIFPDMAIFGHIWPKRVLYCLSTGLGG